MTKGREVGSNVKKEMFAETLAWGRVSDRIGSNRMGRRGSTNMRRSYQGGGLVGVR